MNLPCNIDKIKFNKTSNNYLLIIKNDVDLRTFVVHINSKDAKNISLAKNNIFSERLKTYEMFLSLVDLLKINISKIDIISKNSVVNAQLFLKINNKIQILDCSLVDSLVISYKTLTPIFINDNLFNNIDGEFLENDKYYSDDYIYRNSKSIKLKKLNLSLKKLIKDENYESAAIIRDRISFLKKKIK